VRYLQEEAVKRTYLTVAIPYVNGDPHLGYAYELVLADIVARARRSMPDSEVWLLGGTDDYSLKNVLAAEAAGMPTADFVAAHARRFRGLGTGLGVSFDDFIHTGSDERHRPAVERFWQTISDRGDLYRRPYEGPYCVDCEQFWRPEELVSGRCPEHGTEPEQVQEENWFFRLSAYQELVEHQLASGALEITPTPFRAEVLAFVRAGLEDISVSRSAARARGWGIPVPGDPSQVIYVWFDALANYISALEYGSAGSEPYRRWWLDSDERIHVVGKDIVRFHCVYWPSFLAAAGEPGPTRVHVHPFLTFGGAKISKSSGTSPDPVALIDAYGADAVRWWFARKVHPVVDTDFTFERLIAGANEDLAGGFGNVVNRVVALVHRFAGGVVLPIEASCDQAPIDRPTRIVEALGAFDLRQATQLLLDAVATLNRDLEASAPWQVAQDPARATELSALLAGYVAHARLIAQALLPILPDLSQRMVEQLGGYEAEIPSPQPIYRRIELNT
jgi:methionyl-tRNA synthetase